MRRSVFGLADLLCRLGASHLGVLPHPRLAEDGQQDSGALGREPVRNTYGRVINGRSQLSDPVAGMTSVRLTKSSGMLCEQSNVFIDFEEVLGRQSLKPVPHLGLDLDRVELIHYSSAYAVHDI